MEVNVLMKMLRCVIGWREKMIERERERRGRNERKSRRKRKGRVA